MTPPQWFLRLYQDFWEPPNPLLELEDSRAALLYLRMLSGKQISAAGVLTYSTAALARGMFDWDEAAVERWLGLLEEHGDITIDARDHEILLPRAIRETKVLELRQGLVFVERTLGAITSPRIRERLAVELGEIRDDPTMVARTADGTARRRRALDSWIAQLRGTAPTQAAAVIGPDGLTGPDDVDVPAGTHPSQMPGADGEFSGGIPYGAAEPGQADVGSDGDDHRYGIEHGRFLGGIPYRLGDSGAPPGGQPPDPAAYGIGGQEVLGGIPYRAGAAGEIPAQSAVVMPGGDSLTVALPGPPIGYSPLETAAGAERIETREPLPAVVGDVTHVAGDQAVEPPRPALRVVQDPPAITAGDCVAAYVRGFTQQYGKAPLAEAKEQFGRMAKPLLGRPEIGDELLLRCCELAGANPQWTNLAKVIEIERTKDQRPSRPGAARRFDSLNGAANYDQIEQP